jgi:hypothetical protein
LEYILAKPTNIRLTFNSLPRNAHDAYKGVIKRIEEGKDKATAFKILLWILLARRVLTMGELQEALSIEDGMKELIPVEDLNHPRYVVECCESLVTHNEGTQSVRLTRYTLNEFLYTECRSVFLTSVDLARACITYLDFGAFDVPCLKRHLLKQRLEKYRFAEYATLFCGVHTQGDAEQHEDIQLAILRMFAAESKLTSVLEIQNDSLSFGYKPYDWSEDISETLLHTASRHGLSTICRRIRDNR